MARLCSILSIAFLVLINGRAAVVIPGPIMPMATAAGGSPAFVGFSAGSEVASSTTNSVTKVLTSGNLAVVCVKWETALRTPTITDTAGNTYVSVGQTNISLNAVCEIFYAKNVTGGASVTFGVNFGSATDFNKMTVTEFSGCSTTAPHDGSSSGAAATGTAAATGNVATTAVGALVCVIARAAAGTVTPQASWTEDVDADAMEVQHFISPSSGTYQGAGTISSSQQWAIVMAAFK